MSEAAKIGVLGSKGKMGQEVLRLLGEEYSGKAVTAAAADQGDSFDGLLGCDVVVDFSLPAGMFALAQRARESTSRLPAFVVASTGWKIDERRALEDLAKKTPILMSSNFSTGVLALMEILKTASPLLEKLGYHPSIVETHHEHKKDAPSGTAVSLQRIISPFGPGNVPTRSVRTGEVIGDHTVTFDGKSDQIFLGHHARERSIFARGALDAALWLNGKRAGYSGSSNSGLIGIETFFKEAFLGK